MMAIHSPKLFSAISLIHSNMYCQKKKCNPEILLNIIMHSSYISLLHEVFFPGQDEKLLHLS